MQGGGAPSRIHLERKGAPFNKSQCFAGGLPFSLAGVLSINLIRVHVH